MMMKMKIEPEIVLPYEGLPDSSNDLVKSLKTIQDTVKYYRTMIKELQLAIKDLDQKVIGLVEPLPIRSSIFEKGKGFLNEDIQKFFKKK